MSTERKVGVGERCRWCELPSVGPCSYACSKALAWMSSGRDLDAVLEMWNSATRADREPYSGNPKRSVFSKRRRSDIGPKV